MEVLVELNLRNWSVCLKSEGALHGEREIDFSTYVHIGNSPVACM